MKSRTLIAAIFAVAVAASPAAAQNVAGTWELSVTGGRRGGTQTMTLVMAQDGGALTGTLTRTLGRRGGGGGPMELKLEDGTVEGNSFSFSVTLSFNDNSFTQSFSGTVDGDAMEGSIEGGRGGPQPFTGERN